MCEKKSVGGKGYFRKNRLRKKRNFTKSIFIMNLIICMYDVVMCIVRKDY